MMRSPFWSVDAIMAAEGFQAQASTPCLCFFSSVSTVPVLVDHTHTAPVADPQATYASSALMQGTAFAPAVLKDGESRVWTVSKVTVSTTLTQLSLPAETRYPSLTGETHTELT